MKKIRTGVVGVGFIGRIHIENLRRLGFVDVVAVAEKDQATADKAAEELLVPKAYGRAEDLLRDKDIDVVHLTTLNNLHYPYAKLAMEAGKHVMCEKPLAMNVKEAAELLKLARQKGVAHGVTHSMRYYPMVKQARAMVRGGDIGDVRLIHGQYLQDWLFLDTDWNWRLISKTSGISRAVADIGTHWMDMVQHITGQKIAAVSADMTTFIPTRKKPKKEVATFVVQQLGPDDYEDAPIDTEDHATIMMRFSGGAKGVLVVCQTCAGRKNYIHWEINGTKKTLEWCGEQPDSMWIGERGKPNGVFMKDPMMFHPEAAPYAQSVCGLSEGYLDSFKSVFGDLYRWIRADKPMDDSRMNWPTFVTGLQELIVVDAILESNAKKGQWVEVRYHDGAEAAYL